MYLLFESPEKVDGRDPTENADIVVQQEDGEALCLGVSLH